MWCPSKGLQEGVRFGIFERISMHGAATRVLLVVRRLWQAAACAGAGVCCGQQMCCACACACFRLQGFEGAEAEGVTWWRGRRRAICAEFGAVIAGLLAGFVAARTAVWAHPWCSAPVGVRHTHMMMMAHTHVHVQLEERSAGHCRGSCGQLQATRLFCKMLIATSLVCEGWVRQGCVSPRGSNWIGFYCLWVGISWRLDFDQYLLL